MKRTIFKIGTMVMAATMMVTPVSHVFGANNVEEIVMTDDGIEKQGIIDAGEDNVFEEDFVQDIILNDDDSADDNIEPAGIFATKYLVTTDLYVRSGPGTSYPSLGLLKKGQEIKVKSISDGWAKFKFNGQTGYAYAKYLKKK